MKSKDEIKRLVAERDELERLIASLPEEAFVSKMTFEQRLEEVNAVIGDNVAEPDTLAGVSLYFSGNPVWGSKSIDAAFAAKALDAYQDVVKTVATAKAKGSVSQRGRLPEDVSKAAKLNICGILRGSFGFRLEEDGSAGENLFDSTLKIVVETVSEIIGHISSPDGSIFTELVDEMDPRTLAVFRSFFSHLHDNSALLRIADGKREVRLDKSSIDIAYERVQDTQVEEEQKVIYGFLHGILTSAGRFEIQRQDKSVISGRLSPELITFYRSQLEEGSTLSIGGEYYKMTLDEKKISRHGSHLRSIYTLVKIEEIKDESYEDSTPVS